MKLELVIAYSIEKFLVEVIAEDEDVITVRAKNRMDALRVAFFYRKYLDITILPDHHKKGKFIITADNRPF